MPFDIHSSINTHFDLRKWRPWVCRVTILIVTDASGGFGSQGFDLGHILNVLASDPWPHVDFAVTKAHRQVSGEADVLDDFRFDQHDLNHFSQIWLFGVDRTNDALSPAELVALSRFMDGGGGVFATGDHENLGLAMCGEVLRVRSMRRWHWPSPGPNGEPVAPDQTGAARHDTLTDDPGLPGLQLDQSDKVPQSIAPVMYSRITGSSWIRKVHSWPHPVLCGPSGAIRYLPDHMHEGLCEAPANLGHNWTFNGETFAEYPTHAGHQETPQVIARATSGNGGVSGRFGVIAAYDGHKSHVGRVVVDATWHHWFNINLEGMIAASDPANAAYDATVVPKWEAIKAYYRNVALWLAHRNLQRCLRNGGWWFTAHYYDILITYRPLKTVRDPLVYYWQMGVFARDAMGRFASQCQTARWIIDIIYEKLPWKIDPWDRQWKEPRDTPDWFNAGEAETIAIGGAMHGLVDSMGLDHGSRERPKRDDKRLEKAMSEGAGRALEAYAESIMRAGEEASRMLKEMK